MSIRSASTEEIMRAAAQRTLTSDEILALKSRSFYLPITLLNIVSGEKEFDKRPVVRTAYNLLRELDTIEDAPRLESEVKQKLIDKLTYLVGEVVIRNSHRDINDLLEGDTLRSMTERLDQGIADPEEKVYVTQFGKGVVLQDLHGLEHGLQEDVDYAVKRMADGMKQFLERGEIQTEEQLRSYSIYVAGSIGRFLSKIVARKDVVDGKPVILDEELAQSYGEFLQLTNIIKNVRQDHQDGRIFIPAVWRPHDVSHKYLVESIEAENARSEVFEKAMQLVSSLRPASLEYIMSIPEGLSGYRAFCFLPFVSADKTLENLAIAGPERVFKEDVKISREVAMNIADFGANLVSVRGEDKFKGFLDEYGPNPAKYSFDTDSYKNWSAGWLSEKGLF